MKLCTIAATLALASIVSSAVMAGAGSTPQAKKAVIKCPVTGETIASPKDAYDSEVYKGKTYYFCCAGCKPMFDKDPAKYIKSASAK